MRFALFRFLSIVLLSVAVLSGCRSAGSEFPGKWANKANPSDSFEVVRNGHEYLIVSQGKQVGAIYRTLEVRGALLSTTVTYVKKSDTLLTPGFFGQVDYQRRK